MMLLAFFNGYGEWFIEDKEGKVFPLADLVSFISEHRYGGNGQFEYWEIDSPIVNKCGNFKVNKNDAEQYLKKRTVFEKNKQSGVVNTGFISNLYLIPDDIPMFDKITPPDIALEEGFQYVFKIKKYKNNEVNFLDKINYELSIDEHIDPDSYKSNKNIKKSLNTKSDVKNKNSLDPRLDQTYLLIIGALLDFIGGKNHDIEKHPEFESEAKLIEYIDRMYGEYRGISKRTLESKFAEAKRQLLDTSR